jgi:hypothetical protein
LLPIQLKQSLDMSALPARNGDLLRTRSERPRSYAADQRDEITPFDQIAPDPPRPELGTAYRIGED